MKNKTTYKILIMATLLLFFLLSCVTAMMTEIVQDSGNDPVQEPTQIPGSEPTQAPGKKSGKNPTQKPKAKPSQEPVSHTETEQTKERDKYRTEEAISVIARTHAMSNTPGGKVLKAAVEMVDEKVITLGGCWTYVNKVYEKAGFPKNKRIEIFKVDQTGPYCNPSLILPGDWIMYRNLPYNEVGHSAIFVEWIDFERRSALTIEYVGSNRKIPGRYREADITKIFGLYRGSE